MLLILIASFALWGIGDMISRQTGGLTLATIGKESVTVDQFYRELMSENDQIRRQLGANYSPELLKRLNVPQFVLQRLVQERLLQQESRRIGLIPDDTQVALEIRRNPAFQNNAGMFDKARFENALRNQGMNEKTYVERIRYELASEKLLQALEVDLPTTSAITQSLQTAFEMGRKINLYLISDKLASDVPAPTQEELVAFHQTHAEQFTSPEYRTVSFVRFNGAQKKEAASIPQEAIEAYYREHQDQFKAAEKRNVEQLLYPSEEAAQEAHTLATQGMSFAQIAQKTSALNREALSLGLVEKRALPDGAAEQVFTLKEGDFTPPTKSVFGWHIFRVVTIEAAGAQPLTAVRGEIEGHLKHLAMEQALSNTINQLEDALAGGSTLQEAAAGVGLVAAQAGTFDKDGKTPSGIQNTAIPNLERFVDLAFKTDEGTASPITSSKGGEYYAVRVDTLTPAKLLPLDEVRDKVSAAAMRKKQEKAIADIASKIDKDLADGKSPADIIANHKLPLSASGAVTRKSIKLGNSFLPPALVSTMFNSPIGALVSPLRDKSGDYLVAQIIDFAPASAPSKGDEQKLGSELTQAMHEDMMNQYLRYLEKLYPVTIDQNLLDQIIKETSDAAR